jgi:hypothetical protein
MNIACSPPSPSLKSFNLAGACQSWGGFIAICNAALRRYPISVVPMHWVEVIFASVLFYSDSMIPFAAIAKEYFNHGFCTCNTHLLSPSFALPD